MLQRALLALVLLPGLAAAAPALRHQVTQNGDFVLFGNTVGHDCRTGVPAPTVGTVGACGNNTGDTGIDVLWRSEDPNATSAIANTSIGLTGVTQLRSTAVLVLPAGATVTYARLYWGALLEGTVAADNTVALRRAGQTTSLTVNADDRKTLNVGGDTFYQATGEVTAYLQTHGAGAYRTNGINVLDPEGVSHESLAVGWSMVVFYALPTAAQHNLALFDGLDEVYLNTVSATLSGFLVPNAGYDAKLGVITYEGDNSIGGDRLRFNGVDLFDDANPVDNFFNGSRTHLGTAISVAGDLPRLTGAAGSMSGLDLDVVDVTPRVSPGNTSATIAATSTGDGYYLGAFITSISTFKPEFDNSTKGFADLTEPLDTVMPGDVVEYTVAVTNSGNDTSVGTVLTDPLPAGITFLPGSLRISAGPGAGAGTLTDAAGDDRGEYTLASRTLTVRLGTGADATSGGALAPDESTTVVFRATIDSDISGPIANQATISASGLLGAPPTDTPSSELSGTPGSPTVLVVDYCLADAGCASPTPFCNTAASPKVCVACLDSSVCPATAPVCDPATHACVGCTVPADCTDAARPICDASGACVECTGTGDCGGTTPLCDLSSGDCVGCLDAADCSGTTPICDPLARLCTGCLADDECPAATPACQPGGACGECSTTNDTLCTGATPVCDTAAGLCIGCLANSDCPAAAPLCLPGGVCVQCTATDSTRCTGTTPACNAAAGICAGCSADAQCTDSAVPACQASGACGQCSATNDALCSGTTPVCEVSSGTCVGCLASSECPTDAPFCDPGTDSCRTCALDSECPGSAPACQPSGVCGKCSATNASQCSAPTAICDSTSGTCVGCLAASDCSGTEPVCDAATEACIACTADTQCTDSAAPACQITGACGECSTSNEARCVGTSPVCDAASGTCTGCSGDGDCPTASPACQASGACGECSASNASNCAAPTPVCEVGSGTCVGCLASSECPADAPFCDPATDACRACALDGECPASAPACQPSGACGQCSTSNAAQCSAPTAVCDGASGNCVGCLAASDCGGATPVCAPVSHACQPCAANAECPEQTPICDPSGACRGCTADSDCPVAAPACQPSGVCGQCSANQQDLCAEPTPLCDLEAGRCVGCISDSDCPAELPACQHSGHCGECSATNQNACVGDRPLCAIERGSCVACLVSDGCPAVMPYCDPVLGECAPCTASGAPQCPDVTRPVCQLSGPLAGACTECSGLETALCVGAKPSCLEALGLCGCSDLDGDSECGPLDSGEICNGAAGLCVPGCSSAEGRNDCPAELNCTAQDGSLGSCVAYCVADADCLAAPLLRCDTAAAPAVCVECLGDGDCPAALLCDAQGANRCVECTSERLERCSAEASGAACLENLTCGCVDDGDCGEASSGRVCAEVGKCTLGCRGTVGNRCPSGMFCSSRDDSIGVCQPETDPGLPDAGDSDAGGPDAALPPGDAGDQTDGGPAIGPMGAIEGGGCGCTAGGSSAATALLSLLALAGFKRGRKRN